MDNITLITNPLADSDGGKAAAMMREEATPVSIRGVWRGVEDA